MSDFQAIADRVEIEALRGEFIDAVMMRGTGVAVVGLDPSRSAGRTIARKG